MASATRRGPARWLGRYRGPDGKEHTKTFPTKGEARAWAESQEARLRRGDWTDPQLGRTTVGEYAAEWVASKVQIRQSTRTSYDALLRTHILPSWGLVPLSGVRHEDVAAWVGRLHRNGLSASRTRQACIILSQVLDLAVKTGRIPHNAAKGVELPRLP